MFTERCFFPNKTHRVFSLLLWVLLLWALAPPGTAQTEGAGHAPTIRFDNPFDQTHTVRHQMGGINAIVQDVFGFIWLGSENGLGRYDGHSIKLYQYDSRAPGTLPSNLVWDLAVDSVGVFWQAGDAGLSHYNAVTDDFTHITEIGGTRFSSETILALTVAEDDTLYLGSADGLHVINPARTSMSIHRLHSPAGYGAIRSLAIDAQGQVWIGTAGMGAAIFNPVTEHIEYLVHDPENPQSLIYDHIRTIAHDRQGRVWFGTYGKGISRLDPDTGNFVHFTHSASDDTSLGSNIVVHIIKDSEGEIWIAADQGGLAKFDEASQSFQHYRHSRHDPHSLISNQLRTVYEDRNRDLWIGAFPSGISFYNRSTQIFQHYINRPEEPDSVSDNAILHMRQTGDDTIWVGTENGLNALNPQTGKFRRFMSDPSNPQALQAKPVLAIEEDIDGQLWIGTWAGGLHRFDTETGIFQHYPSDANREGAIKSDFIWDIVRARDDTIWIGTEDAGLLRYHREADSFSHYKHHPDIPNTVSDDYVPVLLEDKQGMLWLGTFSGLNLLDPATDTITRIPYDTHTPYATSGKNIRSLYEDSRGLIWVGTGQQGLSIYDPQTRNFSYISVADGLPSGNISSILEDDSGKIWLSTTNGLARIDPQTRSINHFRREDGIAGINFNRNASLKDRHGKLYFGSTEGITVFHPDDLDKVAVDFPVYITQFRLFNHEVQIGGTHSPLQKSILFTNEIVLQHSDLMFSLNLVALNYRQSKSMHYSYRLEGFDHSWNNLDQGTLATYTNISPGKYLFRTRASTDGKNWVEGQRLTIVILPPPWRTWWAYAFYVLLAGALVFFTLKHITLRVRAETYRNKSITDPLTDTYNRAGIAQIAQGIFANAETQRGMCLMLMDIDHFKEINDQHGHDAGDDILCDVTQVVRNCLRNSDHLGRWGGEEFVLLCASQSKDGSHSLAEKVRAAIERQVYGQEFMPVKVTVSIGVADLRPDDSFESALKRADAALYRAKALGRNRVVLADA